MQQRGQWSVSDSSEDKDEDMAADEHHAVAPEMQTTQGGRGCVSGSSEGEEMTAKGSPSSHCSQEADGTKQEETHPSLERGLSDGCGRAAGGM